MVVSKMTQDDQCTFTATATCDIPTVTVKAATGDMLSSAGKIDVTFIEGTTETLDSELKGMNTMGDFASMGMEGSFFPIYTLGQSFTNPLAGTRLDYGQSPMEKALRENADSVAISRQRPYDFLGQIAMNKKLNDDIRAYSAATSTFAADYTKFQAQLIEKAKYWMSIKYPKDGAVEPKVFKNLPMPQMPIAWHQWTYSKDFAKDIKDFTMLGGYGSLTQGTINVVQGHIKSFGVGGQGTTAGGKGYIFPAEKTGACTKKFITVTVTPKNSLPFTQTGTLTLSFGAGKAQVIDNTELSTDPYNKSKEDLELKEN